MSECPNCHQSIDPQAIRCPYCRTILKAYGHPSIDLYRAGKETFLCQSCTYHADDTCTFPQRPYAKTCTLYHDQSLPLTPPPPTYRRSWLSRAELKRHSGWIALLGIGLFSLFLALANR